MRNKGAITGLLFMGVIIVLATMGLVYGSWEQELRINGDVTTGNVNVELVKVFAEENDAEKTKDFASCESDTFGADTGNGFKVDKISLEIDNGFPGYSCQLAINLENNGTLPVNVTADLSGDTSGAITVRDKDGCGDGNQLNPGDSVFCDWEITVTKAADQKTTYEFDVEILAELVNKPELAGG